MFSPFAALLALSLVLAACGGGDDGADAGGTETQGSPAADGETEAEVDEGAFYAGKELEIIVPFSTGGGTDTQARFMAPFLPNYVPGTPSVGVFNIAGAGGTIGNNQFTNERDGEAATSILYSSASSFLPWIFGDPALELDYRELIGLVAVQTGGVVYVHSSTGITGPEDFVEQAQDISWVAGEQTPDSLGLLFILAYDMLEIDHQVVMGFEGRGPARVSFEQQEININWDTTSSYVSSVQELVDAGTAVPVFTVGQIEDGELIRDPVFDDLPTFEEIYEQIHGEAPSGEMWDSYKALTLSGFTLQKVMWLKENAPDEAVEDMRQAFEDMIDDPEFQDAANEIIGDYNLVTGDAVDGATADLLDFPPELKDFLLDYIVENYDYPDPRT